MKSSFCRNVKFYFVPPKTCCSFIKNNKKTAIGSLFYDYFTSLSIFWASVFPVLAKPSPTLVSLLKLLPH